MSLGELHANEPPQPCVARDIKAAVTLIPRWGESRTETLGLGRIRTKTLVMEPLLSAYSPDFRTLRPLFAFANERALTAAFRLGCQPCSSQTPHSFGDIRSIAWESSTILMYSEAPSWTPTGDLPTQACNSRSLPSDLCWTS